MSRMRAAFSALVFALVIVSCAGLSKPDGRAALEARIREQSQGTIELVSYQKTNALESEVNGVKYLQVEYLAEIRFLVDRQWDTAEFRFRGFGEGGNLYPSTARRRGDRFRVAGVVTYQLAEAGWRVVGFLNGGVEAVESIHPLAK